MEKEKIYPTQKIPSKKILETNYWVSRGFVISQKVNLVLKK
jgi:hypothetical protein